jgi:hypothetical protein
MWLKRTWIPCRAALEVAPCAAFLKESRIKLAKATNLDWKSGERVRQTAMLAQQCAIVARPFIHHHPKVVENLDGGLYIAADRNPLGLWCGG